MLESPSSAFVKKQLELSWIDCHAMPLVWKRCGCLQFYACCIFESLESNWSRKNEGRNSLYNFMTRFLVRGSYVVLSTFVACLLPVSMPAT